MKREFVMYRPQSNEITITTFEYVDLATTCGWILIGEL